MITPSEHDQESFVPTILLVDDTPENLKLLGEILVRKFNCELAMASNGQEALEAAQELKPDLILLDVMMPDMDGFEVCRLLKADQRTADIPIIFLTARMATEDVVQGFKCGAVDYVVKPFNTYELVARVRSQLAVAGSAKMVQQQNHELQQLLHILCHDLLNPIGGIAALMENIDLDELKELVPIILSAANNAVKMIELVREMRAIKEGKKRLALEPVNLQQACTLARDLTQTAWEKKQVDVIIAVDEHLLVMADVTALVNSVLCNLITNAVKFSYAGTAITLQAKAHGPGTVQLIVEDRGIGIPADLLTKIFDLKAQTSRSGTDGEEGTGFGMPLVKEFVQLFGGTIRMESRDIATHPENHGTRVCIDFGS